MQVFGTYSKEPRSLDVVSFGFVHGRITSCFFVWLSVL